MKEAANCDETIQTSSKAMSFFLIPSLLQFFLGQTFDDPYSYIHK